MVNLKNYLQHNQVIYNIKASSYEEIINCLINPLVENKVITNKKVFLQNLLEREKNFSTISSNTAFPIGCSSAVTKITLVCGIAADNDGIIIPNYNQPIKTFFLIATPAIAPFIHIPLLETIVNFSKDKKRMLLLAKQKTAGLGARMLCAYPPKE